jgi:sialic acid synthase SpsE
MKEGEIIQINDLIMMRPGNGISPMDLKQVIGKKILKDLNAGDMLSWQHIK